MLNVKKKEISKEAEALIETFKRIGKGKYIDAIIIEDKNEKTDSTRTKRVRRRSKSV